MNGEIRFAHLSDWHATTLAGGGLDRFRGKRLSGWASWALNRRRFHDPAILDAAIRDVQAQGVGPRDEVATASPEGSRREGVGPALRQGLASAAQL